MRIKQGNDYIIKTSDEWYSPNMRDTVIPEGCICIEKSETNGLSIKLGDGTRKFINLPYISNESVNLADYAKIMYVDEKFENLDYKLPIADKTTLGGVQSGSMVDSTDGLTPVPIIDGIPYYSSTSANVLPAGEELGVVKSGGDVIIANGEITVNDNSHNHAIDNVTGLQIALDDKISVISRGVAGGIAELDTSGKVLSSQLPSYVDAIVEGYYDGTGGKFYNEEEFTIEIPGESNKIYIDKTTSMTYRWTGDRFGNIGGSLVLGENASTAYRGDRGRVAFDHSQKSTGNPHNVTKTDIGLSNVENLSTNDQTPTYTTASTATALTSGEKLTTAMGKIAKTVSNAIDHENNNLIHVTSTEKTYWNSKQDNVEIGTSTVAGITKLYNAIGDNTDGSISQMVLTAVLNEKSLKSIVKNITVTNSDWNGVSAPYNINLSIDGVTETNLVEVIIHNSITDEQLVELKNAQVDKITQSTGSITLHAYGTKPTIDIPISVIIRGDV